MIVNFLFDEFIPDGTGRPWWNMPDIPREKIDKSGGRERRYVPKSWGWWGTDIVEVLTADNPLLTHENEIRIVSSIEHELQSNEINIYPVFVSDKVFESPNALLWIPGYIVDKINEGLVHLVILNYFEPDHVDHNRMYDYYKSYLTSSGINNFKSVSIVGNSPESERRINKLANESNDIRYINGNSWEKFNLNKFHEHAVDTMIYQNEHKSKVFLMQIRSARPWRYFTLKYLEYMGALEHGLYSYIMSIQADVPISSTPDCLLNHQNDSLINSSVTIIDELKSTDTGFLSWLTQNDSVSPKKLPNCKLDNADVMSGSHLDSDWIKDTYFSVICESQMNDLNGILSEKTFKMIYYGHPFILAGSPGLLNELKRLGYETFPELFDESYDKMPCSSRKIKFIAEQVNKWCDPERREELNQIMKGLQPKLEYNRNLFITKDHSKFWSNFK